MLLKTPWSESDPIRFILGVRPNYNRDRMGQMPGARPYSELQRDSQLSRLRQLELSVDQVLNEL
jgi:hypothetical protein